MFVYSGTAALVLSRLSLRWRADIQLGMMTRVTLSDVLKKVKQRVISIAIITVYTECDGEASRGKSKGTPWRVCSGEFRNLYRNRERVAEI